MPGPKNRPPMETREEQMRKRDRDQQKRKEFGAKKKGKRKRG